jgi:uncharacterized protein (TIGR02246 family)
VRSVSRLASAALFFLAACAPPAPRPDPAADEQAIRRLVEQWNEALRSANDSAIGELYADDAVAMPPNMARLTGRPAIRQFFASIWPLKAQLQLATVSVHVGGDWAVEEGNWTWTMPAAGGEQKDNGKYLVSWHRVGNDWKVAQDIWNSDNPPPPAAPAK